MTIASASTDNTKMKIVIDAIISKRKRLLNQKVSFFLFTYRELMNFSISEIVKLSISLNREVLGSFVSFSSSSISF